MRLSAADRAAVAAQLGRPPRSIHAVGHRCGCGLPDVVTTEPRLEDGTPFPTTYYLTCPRVNSLIGTLEGSGLMAEMTDRLESDPALAAAYRAAHESYLADRAEIGSVPEIEEVSAGGMPTRVKCLHALVAHALAKGPGVNPFGDEALAELGQWWAAGPCVPPQVVAAIDCGTNSIRLLIVDLTTGTDLVRENRMVRLGEGVDETGRISAAAMERAVVAMDEYAALIAAHDVTAVRFCATSASRDAENALDFVAAVRDRFGVEPEIIAGVEEARLSFAGACGGLVDLADPVLVVDIGGGSTELVLGGPEQAVSLDIGAVRLYERHLASDPPTPAELDRTRADVDALLDGCGVDIAAACSVVGVAGTITTTSAGVLGLPEYDQDRIHGARLPVEGVLAMIDRLLAMTTEERRALPYMHPGRADIVAAGAVILERILERASVDCLIASETDILDGIAWSLHSKAP